MRDCSWGSWAVGLLAWNAIGGVGGFRLCGEGGRI